MIIIYFSYITKLLKPNKSNYDIVSEVLYNVTNSNSEKFDFKKFNFKVINSNKNNISYEYLCELMFLWCNPFDRNMISDNLPNFFNKHFIIKSN